MQIIRKEYDGTHYYYVDGQFYPSVTHILDVAGPKEYGLLNFFKQNTPDQIEEVKTRTADMGTDTHNLIEALLLGEEIQITDKPEKVKKAVYAFTQWYDLVEPKNHVTEHTVASAKYRYAGTLDLMCEINGKLTLVDFKTTSGIYFSHKVQIMAYKQAVEEMYGRKVEQCSILRLGTKHKAGYEYKEVEDVTVEDFNRIYGVYLTMNNGEIPEPPMINVYPDRIKLKSVSLGKYDL